MNSQPASEKEETLAEANRLLHQQVSELLDELRSVQPASQKPGEKRPASKPDQNAALTELQIELSRARQRPWKLVRDGIRFRVLTFLSRQSPPIPPKMAARFAKSALKRDPLRSLPASARQGSESSERTTYPKGQTFAGHVTPDPSKPSILLVSHEATRTGAPILVLNLIRALGARYNVSALCLRGGELLEDFRQVSTKVVIGNGLHNDPALYKEIIHSLCTEQKFSFAVVNSVVSRATLKCLQDEGVPTVALIHEFAAYTSPKTGFQEVFLWADQVVFSSRLTLENALSTVRLDNEPLIQLIPQGKCEVPTGKSTTEDRDVERAWLQSQLRPDDSDPDRFVVIGGGMAELRKGIELFIEVARRVVDQPGGENAHFYWIGGNYHPDTDFIYSAFLKDQIERADLADRMTMLRPTSEIEYAYELADVFLLSSRLDPLPNVAIDALSAGLPVVGFEDATGIADYLIEAGLGEACVAKFLDTSELAGKVLALKTRPELRAEVGKRSRALAAARFDFPSYAAEIEKLGEGVASRVGRLKEDIATIQGSGAFRADFFAPAEGTDASEIELIRYYAALTPEDVARRPEPGFHPQIYAEQMGLLGTEAYADFLRKGRPSGPWLLPVIELNPEYPATSAGLRAALHIHAYFISGLRDIIERLNRNRSLPDLFISVADQRSMAEATEICASYQGALGGIQIVPNRGRDIGPFLTGFAPGLVADYAVIGHVHVKKSDHVGNARTVSNWTGFLYENLLGGPKAGSAVDRILGEMAADPELGIVYPADPNIISWTQNRPFARSLARQLGHEALPSAINFPVGTMFWMRSEVLKRFTDLGLTWDDYTAEPVPYDGTMLHALERLFGVLPALDGWKSAVTNVRGVTR